MTDLEERPMRAAEAAIRDQRQSLAHTLQQVRDHPGTHTRRGDQVKEAIMFTECRTADGALLARQVRAG
jgi:hypothetical protein